VQMQDTFEGIGRFLPRPLAGEGWGEGVCDRECIVCFSLTLALSQREREFLFSQEVSWACTSPIVDCRLRGTD